MRTVTSAMLLAGLCFGQAPGFGQAAPQFDVVSIRPNRPDDRGGGMKPIPGGFSARNLSVNTLIQAAYDLKQWQIVGGPGWVATDHYDIEAKAEGNPGFKEKLEMFRPLLADRFQLKFHRETRRMPIYSLTPGKNGPKLQATTAGIRGYIRPGRGLIEGKAVSMRTLADLLGGSLGQPVTDATGLAGGFDVRLEWTPTEGELDYNFDGRPVDANGSSIFTAIQEQLGLKLEPGKGPVEVLVVDHVERPSAN
jgi:uncharacterized protein (TIGR03435 family)